MDGGESVSGSPDGQVLEKVVRLVRRAQPSRAVPPLATDPGIWLNIVNVKPPYLVDLEVESMKKIWSIRDIMCSEAGERDGGFYDLGTG